MLHVHHIMLATGTSLKHKGKNKKTGHSFGDFSTKMLEGNALESNLLSSHTALLCNVSDTKVIIICITLSDCTDPLEIHERKNSPDKLMNTKQCMTLAPDIEQLVKGMMFEDMLLNSHKRQIV